jgi:glycosyltransferase involved in cell wall biosynthesis
MKIAVYAIALNEEQFVQRWFDSAQEADYLLIADTGSTDQTIEIANRLGINVVNIGINPWRFDDARNASLAAIPLDIDYCIALDMDEVLVTGWRKELESVTPETTRPRYQYTWSWNQDGTPGLTYGGDKIHARKGYRWKHPVHEVLSCQGDEIQSWLNLEIHHYPDDSKSRGQYFPLLRLAVKEDESDDRNAFYYARELFFHKHYEDAIKEFKRHLALPKAQWKPERAASMRYLAKCDGDNRQSWLLKAIAEYPTGREARVDLAEFYLSARMFPDAYDMAHSALAITDKPLEYLNESAAWSYAPLDVIAVSAFYLGKYEEALATGTAAYELAPWIERLKNNLDFYKGELNATG